MRLMRIALGSALVALTTTMSLAPALAAGVKTSKERLSDKASDDQRVDNCKVPIERRGPAARPDCQVNEQANESATPPKGGESTGQR